MEHMDFGMKQKELENNGITHSEQVEKIIHMRKRHREEMSDLMKELGIDRFLFLIINFKNQESFEIEEKDDKFIKIHMNNPLYKRLCEEFIQECIDNKYDEYDAQYLKSVRKILLGE